MTITGTSTSSFGVKGRINHDSQKFYSSKLYRELNNHAQNKPSTEDLVENFIEDKYINTIIEGCATQMKELPDNSIHLMITSPPYNVQKEYDDDLSLSEYLLLLENTFREVYRVLVWGGRACINVANLGRKPYLPLASFVNNIMNELGFLMRGEIIWNKGSSAGTSTAWGSWQSAANPVLRDVHEYILIFSKGDYKRNKKNGINTIEKKEFMEWTKSVWNMSAERAKRVGHPAPFPVELPLRLIHLLSFQDDIILDPFMGSGTTGIAAIETHRKFVGYEINSEYVSLARQRLHPYLVQPELHLPEHP